MTFRPMLAATLEDFAQLRFPLLASVKLDGVRCLAANGVALSRNLKPFRNKYVQDQLAHIAHYSLDGELIVGPPNIGHVLGRTQSGVMSADGEPDFKYYIFDRFTNAELPFENRIKHLEEFRGLRVEPLVQKFIETAEALALFEATALNQGYEGVILRCPKAKYKFGRATPNENSMWKLKRFRDGEARVMDLEEGVTNLNPSTTNALGLAERSNVTANKVGNGQVGTLICKDLISGEIFPVSPGRMVVAERKRYFVQPGLLLGRVIKYKTFDYGKLDAPRFATFQAFRDSADMDA